MQLIGILLVVAGHSLHEYPDGQHGETSFLHRAIYSFHMPLFVFVSGFLMFYSSFIRKLTRLNPRDFVWKKTQRLIIPFVTLTLITFVPRVYMSSFSDEPIDLNLKSFVMAFVEKDHLVIPFFWFLQAIFILLIVSYLIYLYAEKLGISAKTLTICILPVALLFYFLDFDNLKWFSINRVFELWIFFILGCAWCLWMKEINRIITWNNPLFFAIILLCWLASVMGPHSKILSFLSSLLGIMMTISLSMIMIKNHWRFFDHLTGANYMIFLLSWYSNIAFQQLLSHFIVLPWWVYSCLSLIGGIYIPYLGYRYLISHPGSRWIRITAMLLGHKLSN